MNIYYEEINTRVFFGHGMTQAVSITTCFRPIPKLDEVFAFEMLC